MQLVGNKVLHISISRKMYNSKQLITSSREVKFFSYNFRDTYPHYVCNYLLTNNITPNIVNVYNSIQFNTNFHNPRSRVSLAIGITTKTNNNFCMAVITLLAIPQKHSLNKSPMPGRDILPYVTLFRSGK